MNKSIAKIKLASAIKSRDKATVKSVMDWASLNLSTKAFVAMFIKDLSRFPDHERQWFNDEFQLVFSSPKTGKIYIVN